ncbi:MAG: hypothetical protein PHD72_03410 [Patescibacteria group bacterium]|nr:hypothetical protein [Patescibacteria group bacterium]
MSESISNKKYNYLIVPCAGDPRFEGDKIIFSDLENDKIEPNTKLYLGAEDRMKAAILMAKDAERVVLVGGSQSKVTAMYIYFKKEMDRPQNSDISNLELICLVSKPDSTGNLSAFKKYLTNNKQSSKRFNIAIISNGYHLPRLKLMWESLFEMKHSMTRLSAEKELKTGLTKDMYVQELKRRKIREAAGCRDWEKGRYDNQEKIVKWDEKNSDFWTCEELSLDFEVKK